ncbi:MAG: hypothetical protein RIT05_627 [Bacteroidota bacterium]|jgi:hypothetical protein
MKKIIFFLLAIGMLSISSCKKEKTPPPSLVGKWTLKSVLAKDGATVTLNYTGVAGDYMDFKTTGSVEMKVGTSLFNFPYTISGSTVTIDGDPYQIQTLTANAAVLYFTKTTAGVKSEETVTLER